MADYRPILPQFVSGQSLAVDPSGLGSGVGAGLRGLLERDREQEAAQRQAAQIADLQETFDESAIIYQASPEMRPQVIADLKQRYISQGDMASAQQLTRLEDMDDVTLDNTLKTYISRTAPMLKVDTKFLFGDPEASQKARDEKFDKTQKVMEQLRKVDPDFIKIQDAYGRVSASAQDPSPAGDLALIFNYMKLLDPGSTVREGEFQTAQGAMAALGRAEEKGEYVPNFVKSITQQLMEGTRLLEDQRADFLDRSQRLYQSQVQSRESRLAPIREQIREFNLDESQIFPAPITFDIETTETTAAEFPNAPKVGTVDSGYRYKGGDPQLESSWEKVK